MILVVSFLKLLKNSSSRVSGGDPPFAESGHFVPV